MIPQPLKPILRLALLSAAIAVAACTSLAPSPSPDTSAPPNGFPFD